MNILGSYWQFWAFLAAIFAALTAILAKVGVNDVDPDYATFLRTVVIVAVLGAILYLRATPRDGLTIRSAVFLVLSGLGTGASWVCYFRALKLGNASQVAPVDKLSVVFVAVFAAVFLGEHLSMAGWLGVALIAVGATLVALA